MDILFLVSRPNLQGPIPKITPLLVSGLQALGCRVITAPWGRHHDRETLADKALGRSLDILHIRRLLDRQPFDMLVVTTAHDWAGMSRDIPLLLAARSRCPRIVLQFHGSLSQNLLSRGQRAMKAASHWLVGLADATLLLSTQEQREWQAFHPAGRFYRVSNPFLPAPAGTHPYTRASFNLPADRPVLLFAGRLIAAKGIFDLLDALPRVIGHTPCHLLIAGAGGDESRVRQRIAELGLAAHVTMAGYLQGDALQAAYRLADALVLPTFWAEGFPTVIAEAMDAGLPIVTTAIRGMVDHLSPGENALFVPAQDPEALAATLQQLLTQPALRVAMGQANRERVRAFEPKVVAQEYLTILREIAAQP